MTDTPIPHSPDAEASVVAAVMVDPEAIARVEPIVLPQHFHDDRNRWAFESALRLWQRGDAINQITLAQELTRGEHQDVDWIPYLSRVVDELPTPVGIEHYAKIVRTDAGHRRMIQIGAAITELAYKGGPDLEANVAAAERMLAHIERKAGDAEPLSVTLESFWEKATEVGAIRAKSGLELDRLCGGFHAEEVTIVAARPSVGKSALLLTMARNMAMYQNAKVLWFSIEMSRRMVACRFLSQESGIPLNVLIERTQDEHDEQLLAEADDRLRGLGIEMRYGSLTYRQMRSCVRTSGADVVMLDYLQLMDPPDRAYNKEQGVSELSRNLKLLAIETGTSMIIAAQLNRESERRSDPTPKLSDIRDSGAVEQDADKVILLHRAPDDDGERKRWAQANPGVAFPNDGGVTNASVAKNRNGPTGALHLRFLAKCARFEDLVPADEPAQAEMAV